MWTPGIELTANEKTRNLRASERRAHAAKVSHQRRRATKDIAVKQSSKTPGEESQCLSTGSGSITYESPPLQSWSLAQRDGLWLAAKSLFGDDVASKAEQKENVHQSVKAFDLQLTWYSSMQREPESQCFAIFDSEYQKRSFHLWTTSFSDRAAKFGVYCSSVFFRIIPQHALVSPMLRDMVLAHSFACEHWKADPRHAHSLSVKALHHYTKGLKAMYESKPDTHDFIAAIMMAFLLEARQNHYAGAAQHVGGYEKIIMNYQGVHDEDYQNLKGCYYTMRTYGELWELGQLSEPVQEPWSTFDARNTIAHTIHQAEEYTTTRNPLQLHRIKKDLGTYLNVDKDQYRTKDITLNQEAILLLLHVTVTILPSEIVGWLSSATDPDQLNHLLSIAETFLKQIRRTKESEKELLITLEMLATSVLRNVLDDGCQQRAVELLQNTLSRMIDLGI